MALEITSKNYEGLISSEKLLLIDFGAEWCGPCKALSPIIDELAKEFTDTVNICKCDVEENDDLAVKYAIRNVPTLLYLKNGEVVDRQVGATTKSAIIEKIEAYL